MNEPESDVYDLIYPSPVTLKEISSIVVVVELWREEICAHTENGRSQKLKPKLDLKENDIRLRNVIPNLPSAIYDYLEEYVGIFRVSILRWLNYHRGNIFTSCDYGSLKNILIRFHDFSWDWNGTIHYGRTAKRMILCDQFDEEEKFKIACLYCFEDDIKRLWPSISSNMDWSSVDFDHFPQLFYWICFLRNELDKVPNPRNVSMDEAMLYKCKSQSINRSFVKYFWDRIPSDKQAQIVIERYVTWSQIFCRFILQKLNKHHLEMFLSAKGADFMGFLLYFGDASELRTAFRTWMYIQNGISCSHFISFVNKSFQCECNIGGDFYAFNTLNLFCKIWKSAPQHLKRSAVENILSNNPSYLRSPGYPLERKQVKFLIVLLQDATVEERNTFWREHWRNFIRWCGADNRDFIELMKLCLRTENEIALFNKATMARYENIVEYCVPLLKSGSFKELNDFLSVCCPDLQKRNELKQRLLRSNYVGQNSVLTTNVISNHKLLNEFVNDAFQDSSDLGVKFRNQLASSLTTQNCVLECIRGCNFDPVMEFIDSFFPDEQVVVPLKKRLFECFKGHLINGDCFYAYKYCSVDVQGFLIWLLGNEGEIIRFKQSISVEDISRKLLPTHRRKEPRDREVNDTNDFKPELPLRLDNFLTWYFNNDEEEIDKFLKVFYGETASFAPRKRRRMQ